MRLSKEDRETLVSFGFLVVSVLLFLSVFLIPSRGKALQSARLLPFIVTGIMILISTIYFITSISRARPSLGKLKGSFVATVTSPEWKRILFAIALVAVYVFVAVPYIGYYISSLALILFVFLFYVRRIKPWVSIAVSFLLTGLLYLIFAVAFKLTLR